jgi:putative phosphoesterase
MLVGILSDTHDMLDAVRDAVDLFQARGVDAVIHGGDIVAPFCLKILVNTGLPVHGVFGNNDGERAGLARLLPALTDGPLDVELGGRRFRVIHDLASLGANGGEGADVVLSGHTHRVLNERRGDALFLNPGEACGWLTGHRTVMLYDTETDRAELVALEPDGS